MHTLKSFTSQKFIHPKQIWFTHWFCAKPADNSAGIYLNFEQISHLVLVFLLSTFTSSHPEVFLIKGVLKICSKFTGEHPCRSAISITLLCNVSFQGVISRKVLQTIYKFGMINKSNKNHKEGKYYEGC